MIHPDRQRRTEALARLDPDSDWHEIYKRLTLWELPKEARFGFQLAFYRPLAVPRMAAVLYQTGRMRHAPTRRAYDTGIVIHEIIWGGVESDRGRRMIRLMDRLHDRPDIHGEDMSYILDALTVVPTRFMDRYGWRPTTPAEREASWRFYDVLGDKLAIPDRATSYSDAEQRLVAYETEHLAPSEPGRALTAVVVATLKHLLPVPARPLAAQLTATLVSDPAVCAALGLPRANPALLRLIDLGGAARRQFQRLRPGRRKPSFWPGRPAGAAYPHGYTLDQVDPDGRTSQT